MYECLGHCIHQLLHVLSFELLFANHRLVFSSGFAVAPISAVRNWSLIAVPSVVQAVGRRVHQIAASSFECLRRHVGTAVNCSLGDRLIRRFSLPVDVVA